MNASTNQSVIEQSAPWRVQIALPARVPIVYDSANRAVAVIGGTRPSGKHVERQARREAYAQAVAALPELLAALSRIVEKTDGPLAVLNSSPWLPLELAAARLAIARATQP